MRFFRIFLHDHALGIFEGDDEQDAIRYLTDLHPSLKGDGLRASETPTLTHEELAEAQICGEPVTQGGWYAARLKNVPVRVHVGWSAGTYRITDGYYL